MRLQLKQIYALLSFALVLCSASFTVFATNERIKTDTHLPPWLRNNALNAALAIDLTDEQKPKFQNALNNFLQNHADALRRVMRRNNLTHMEHHVRKVTNKEANKLDQSVELFLEVGQLERYQEYRDVLVTEINAWVLTPTDFTRNDGATSGTKHGGAIHH